jgi:hypothetical protein
MRSSIEAEAASAAGYKGIDGHSAAGSRSADYTPRGLMAQHQRSGPALVPAVISMHVRSTNADSLDVNEHLASGRYRIGLLPVFERSWTRINQCFHRSISLSREAGLFRGEAAIHI